MNGIAPRVKRVWKPPTSHPTAAGGGAAPIACCVPMGRFAGYPFKAGGPVGRRATARNRWAQRPRNRRYRYKGREGFARKRDADLRLALAAGGMGTFEVDLRTLKPKSMGKKRRLLGLPKDTRVVSVEELRKRVPIGDLSASDVKQEATMTRGR